MSPMSSLFGTRNENTDALEQRVLTQLLIDVAEGHQTESDLISFFLRHAWPKSTAGKRVVHALRTVKHQRADIYSRAREIVEPIYQAL